MARNGRWLVTDAQSEAVSLRKLEMYPSKSGFNISFQRASVNLLDTRTIYWIPKNMGPVEYLKTPSPHCLKAGATPIL